MDLLRKSAQKHRLFTWTFVLTYIAFNGCFGFPFSNEFSPFGYSKGLIITACYGYIGLSFTLLFGRSKEIVVLVATLFFTIIGMIGRYYLEFGEVSNAMNFTPINITLYLIIVPIYCTLIYWFINKLNTK